MPESSTLLYGATQRRILRVTARAWSSDMDQEVSFDVTGYLETLPEEDICEMVDGEWRQGDIKGALLWADRAGDMVARSLVEYCIAREQSFSVLIDAEAADDWYATRA